MHSFALWQDSGFMTSLLFLVLGVLGFAIVCYLIGKGPLSGKRGGRLNELLLCILLGQSGRKEVARAFHIQDLSCKGSSSCSLIVFGIGQICLLSQKLMLL